MHELLLCVLITSAQTPVTMLSDRRINNMVPMNAALVTRATSCNRSEPPAMSGSGGMGVSSALTSRTPRTTSWPSPLTPKTMPLFSQSRESACIISHILAQMLLARQQQNPVTSSVRWAFMHLRRPRSSLCVWHVTVCLLTCCCKYGVADGCRLSSGLCAVPAKVKVPNRHHGVEVEHSRFEASMVVNMSAGAAGECACPDVLPHSTCAEAVEEAPDDADWGGCAVHFHRRFCGCALLSCLPTRLPCFP